MSQTSLMNLVDRRDLRPYLGDEQPVVAAPAVNEDRAPWDDE